MDRGLPRYDAILFDFDGVLADTEPLHWECWRDALEPIGVECDWETYRDCCVGLSDRELLTLLCRRRSRPVDARLAWEQRPRKVALFRERIAANSPIKEATAHLVKNLSLLYKLAVVSSSDRSEIEPPLVRAGIRSHLGALVAGNDVQNPKPSPEPYQLAASLLGVRSALVVEDSRAGLESGRAAGFDVLEVESADEMPGQLRAWLGHIGDFR